MFTAALNTHEARNRNLAAVLQAIREHPGASRKELGREMPFTLQTMTNVVQELMDMGVVAETDRPASGSRGNPHRGLKIVGERGYVLAVQFRWNACLTALVDLEMNVVERRTWPIETNEDDPHGYIETLCGIVCEAQSLYKEKDIWAVAVSGPLPIEGRNVPLIGLEYRYPRADQTWFVKFAASVTSSMIGESVAKACGLPVRVFNNSQSAALAEAQALPRNARFVYILAGLGLGASFVSGGALSQDVWKQGGELGHVMFQGQTLSSIISASGLRMAIDLNLAHGEMESTLEQMAMEHPEAFDPWLEKAGPIFRFLVNFVETALWPDGVAVSGFMPTLLIDRLIESAMPLTDSVVLKEEAPDRILPRIFRAKHGDQSIPFGAAGGVLSYRANADLAGLLAARRK